MLTIPQQVAPAAGLIKPEQEADVSVHHEELHKLEELTGGAAQSWWAEDGKDKELTLLVTVQGSCSTDVKTHRVTLRHRSIPLG